MARDSEVLFKVGVLSFLLGHIALIVTFMIGGVDPIWCVLASPFVLFTAQRVYHWLAPHVTGSMRSAVSAYILVISSMLIIAIGTLGADQPWERLFGASAFFVSDLAVARQRFITPTIVNRLWGLPLYYVAQFTLAGSLTLA